jgi:hypothetical protein
MASEWRYCHASSVTITLWRPSVTRIVRILALLAIAAIPFTQTKAVAQAPDADGVVLPRLELGLYGMLQTILSSTTADEVATSALDIRRARVGVTGQYGDALSGRVQVELVTGTPALTDAFVDVVPGAHTRIRAGRAYRPFGLLSRTSSAVILPIERGLRIRGVTGREHQNLLTILEHAGRELGLQASTTFSGAFSPGVQAGVFFPERTDGSRFGTRPDLSVRVSAVPTTGLTVGASGSHRPVESAGEATSARALAVDASLDRGPLRVMAELTGGTGAPLWEDDFVAGQLWAGYRLPFDQGGIRGIEPTGRISHAAIEGAEAGTLLTPGVTFHLGGRDRLMLNYDHWIPGATGAPAHGAAKVMLQLVF